MSFPICYLNGQYLPLSEARISPLDRGFLFADSVYEVVMARDGQVYRWPEHCRRLERSLKEIRLEAPVSSPEILSILTGLLAANSISRASLYVQITRGMGNTRTHLFPAQVVPTIFAMAMELPEMDASIKRHGINAITAEDFRWDRCDIKANSLLANVLMRQAAADVGAQEAFFVRDGHVCEGTWSSIIVVHGNRLATPPAGARVLAGTTRDIALDISGGEFVRDVRPVAVSELRDADEIWLAATTRDLLPVTWLDSRPVGRNSWRGKPGPVWLRMCELFAMDHERALSKCEA
jgi:D-alanine transaminase